MSKTKLSYSQLFDLKALAQPRSPQERRGCTNSTLCALEKRGLAELYFPGGDLSKALRWKITPAGRAALSASSGRGK